MRIVPDVREDAELGARKGLGEAPRGVREETVKAGRRARKAGANALWPKASALCCGDEKEADLVVDYYEKLTRLGSPIIASLDDGDGRPLDWTVDTGSRLGQIEGVLMRNMVDVDVLIPYRAGELVNLFHKRGHIEEENYNEQGTCIRGKLPARLARHFEVYAKVPRDV